MKIIGDGKNTVILNNDGKTIFPIETEQYNIVFETLAKHIVDLESNVKQLEIRVSQLENKIK